MNALENQRQPLHHEFVLNPQHAITEGIQASIPARIARERPE